MSTSVASFPNTISPATTRRAAVSWTIWAGVLGLTSSSIGGAWDVSWHRSIGRDSFLTPAHIAIYLCGIVAAVVSGYLIFGTTFGHSAESKRESVSVLGLRAPLGAFLTAWGGIAMLVSAPFDNWWHAAYGLDVKIISPPHTLLILGIRGISIGILFLILAAMNRAGAPSAAAIAGNSFAAYEAPPTASHIALRRLFLYMGGMMVVGQMFFLLEPTWDVMLHRAAAYAALGMAVPIVYAIFSRASGYRWAATTCAAIYTVFQMLQVWILPLAPATPKLGPVYHQVTHLVPPNFPILIIVPAIALDLLWHRLPRWKPWQIAAVSGMVFIVLLVAVEWPFASFLMTRAAENRFFGSGYFDYNTRSTDADFLRQFVKPQHGAPLLFGLLRASIYASISTWLGLRAGNWMRGVQR